MTTIPRKYIVNESNEKVAVQLDIEIFEKLESLVIDYALGQILDNDDDEVPMNFNEAKSYYQQLDKKD